MAVSLANDGGDKGIDSGPTNNEKTDETRLVPANDAPPNMCGSSPKYDIHI